MRVLVYSAVAVAIVAVVLVGELLAVLLAAAAVPWCWCGHRRLVHEHDRPGNDCAQCSCPRFRGAVTTRVTPWEVGQ